MDSDEKGVEIGIEIMLARGDMGYWIMTMIKG